LTICFFMLHNPYNSKKWYLSMHRLACSLTNQRCGPLLIWNGPLQIWNGTLFSKMAPWCGQVRGHSLFDKKFFPIHIKFKDGQECKTLTYFLFQHFYPPKQISPFESRVNGHKYSSPSILRYIFHIKPHFSKILLWSHF
jgi:hypothetical protein